MTQPIADALAAIRAVTALVKPVLDLEGTLVEIIDAEGLLAHLTAEVEKAQAQMATLVEQTKTATNLARDTQGRAAVAEAEAQNAIAAAAERVRQAQDQHAQMLSTLHAEYAAKAASLEQFHAERQAKLEAVCVELEGRRDAAQADLDRIAKRLTG